MFRGNPKVAISAVDVSGGIVTSYDTGSLPCFIEASAELITATGTSYPRKDLEFRFDFGDSASAEYFISPVDGLRGNSNLQCGHRALHCYRTAGTKTITLTIRWWDGTAFHTTSTTKDVTVSAFNPSGGEWYFDSVNGLDANNGLTSATPKQSMTALNALIASNTKFNLACGSDWTGTTGIEIGHNVARSALRFAKYVPPQTGATAKPKIINSGGGSDAFAVHADSGGAGTFAKSDIVFNGLQIGQTTGATASNAISILPTAAGAALLERIYFDGCSFTSDVHVSGGALINWGTAKCKAFGLWNCDFVQPLTQDTNRFGVYGGSRNQYSIVGGSFIGAGRVGTSLDHHIYPQAQDSLYKWIDFGSGPGRNYCIDGNYQTIPAGAAFQYADGHLISECKFSGTSRAVDLSNATNDPTLSLFKNVVIEGCLFTGLTSNQMIFFYCAEDVTVRDNYLYNVPYFGFFSPDLTALGGILKAQVYGNKLYYDGTTTTGGATIALAGFTLAQQISGNTIVDLRAAVQCVSVTFASVPSNGSIVDGNQYYAPNDSDAKFLFDGSTGKTFGQWQAQLLDTTGLVSNPGWIDPANGVFDVAAGKRRMVVKFDAV